VSLWVIKSSTHTCGLQLTSIHGSKLGNTVGHVSRQVVKYTDSKCGNFYRRRKKGQNCASSKCIHSTGPEENQE